MDACPTMPSVAVIVPLMDRATDLRFSLPRMLVQDFANYAVYLVDNSSIDDVDRVLSDCEAVRGIDPFSSGMPQRSRRLVTIRRPRPEVFSFSISRNCGVRCSESDLLLFVNGDSLFAGPDTLRTIVNDFQSSPDMIHDWFAQWRLSCGFPRVTVAAPVRINSRFRRVFVHAGGSLLLVERLVFQQLGGYNELLADWGYEDTDLLTRLELAGFSRIEMRGVQDAIQENAEALRVQHFRVKDREQTWTRNRLISDCVIERSGVVCQASRVPGDSPWVRRDGRLVANRSLPQSQWAIEPPLSHSAREAVLRIAEDSGRQLSSPQGGSHDGAAAVT